MNAATNTRSRTVGQVVIDTLRAYGVNRAYCVPGESYLGILEAVRELGDAFDLVVCRHEGGAAYMAEASGRMTGLPGVCMVTRGPGSCNATIGLHTALHEGTPLILLVGDVTTGTKGRVAFQDIDFGSTFGGVSKAVLQIDRADSAAGVMRQAFQVAMAGKPGPVVVAITEDVQFETVQATLPLVQWNEPMAPGLDAIAQLSQRLSQAHHPLFVVGGTKWTASARADLQAFAERFQVPVASTFRRLDLMDNACPNYVGSIGVVTPTELGTYLKECDLLVLMGGEFGEIETARYNRLTEVTADRYFVHAAPIMEEFGLVLQPNLAVTTDMGPLCRALVEMAPVTKASWAKKTQALRLAYEAFCQPVQFEGRINPAVAVEMISEFLPADAVITLGAGNYTHFALRHHQYRAAISLLAPICAPMGYSIPAAIAAALEAPDRDVVAYAGDGCFLMNAQELVTAVHRKLNLTVVLLNNGLYGSIRMHQELRYPGRPIATHLHNPDFQAYAAAFGLPSRQVREPKEVIAAWKELRKAHAGPILIEMLTDPAIISPQRIIEDPKAALVAEVQA
jgi:acetolactate synthase-1/2/3 large subunit